MSKLFDVYVAIPYSHNSLPIKEYRFHLANKYTAELYNNGTFAFSPITHSHPLHVYGTRTDFEFYEPLDLKIIENCKELHVIIADGWLESRGVQAEIAHAHKHRIPVKYICPKELNNIIKASPIKDVYWMPELKQLD